MAHRLALVAGELDVKTLLRNLPAKQFLQWKHYYELEPFGAGRDNYHAAQIVQALYRVHSWKTKDGKDIELEDLLLKFGAESTAGKPKDPKPKVDPRIVLAMANAIAMSQNNPRIRVKDV